MSRAGSTWTVARRDGFTLVELIVVMLILTLVAGVTVPALLAGREPDDDMTGAVRRVEELFRLARDSAIRGGTAVTVVMDSATNLVWLVPDQAPEAGDGSGGITLLDEGTALDLPATVEVLLGQTRARFTFLPTGATIGDSLVISHAGTAVRLTLDPWTGDVIAR